MIKTKLLKGLFIFISISFLIFLIYKLRVKAISKNQFIKYLVSLLMVGFSLALPLYLYDNYEKNN